MGCVAPGKKKNWAIYDDKYIVAFIKGTSYSWPILMKLWILSTDFSKII